MRRFFTLVVLIVCALGVPAAAGTAYPFAVATEPSAAGHRVLARNSGPSPVSVRLTLAAADNVASTQPLPVYAVVRPYSEMLLLQVDPLDPGRGHRFTTQSTYRLGSVVAVPDPRALYRLPFENGRSFVVSQAAGGPITTHHGEESRYAVDFRMPENTPIVAARAGLVIETESSYRLGGRDPALLAKANYVSILQADETIATYAHLAYAGVRVSPGQRVQEGTLIGYSGATGYTSGAHLHLVVHRLVRAPDGLVRVSLPLRFYVGALPRVFAARYGELLTADYSPASGRMPSVAGEAPPLLRR